MDADRHALEQKLIGLYGNLLNFALTLTPNRQDANDLAQETTLRALSNLDKYYDNANFKGWVFTIMHNLFVNNYRHMVRSHVLIDQTKSLYILDVPHGSGIDCPEGAYSVREMNNLINSFDENYRVPFKMHLSGYKYEEIASQLRLPLGTVKNRIFYIRKRLQEILTDR